MKNRQEFEEKVYEMYEDKKKKRNKNIKIISTISAGVLVAAGIAIMFVHMDKGVITPGGNEPPTEKGTYENIDVLVEGMNGVSGNLEGNESLDFDEKIFATDVAGFSFGLLKKCNDEDDNILVSPLSIMQALGMTANGASGETKEQMEKLLSEELNLDLINKMYKQYVNEITSDEAIKLAVANSIWINNNVGFTVNQEFATKCLSYYDAKMYSAPFNMDTVNSINQWVSDNTDAMIDKIIDRFSGDEMMVIINAIVFDAEWERIYYDDQVRNTPFYGIKGTNDVEGMYSEEKYYLEDDNTTGFIKDYKGGFRFVALLPDEDVDIDDYIQNFTEEKYMELMANKREVRVDAMLPKFEYDYQIGLIEPLKEMGMEQAFMQGQADFTQMSDEKLNMYISDVIHKTHIKVGEKGTKAAAVTAVIVEGNSVKPIVPEIKEVHLNRPFVYVIIDEKTEAPIFIGAVKAI